MAQVDKTKYENQSPDNKKENKQKLCKTFSFERLMESLEPLQSPAHYFSLNLLMES